jgi:hypothetical protein
MADLSDVENAIVAEVVGALYPNGATLVSAVGVMCRIYRGWPSPAALNADLAAGIVNVTVFPATAVDEVLEAYFGALYTGSAPCSLRLSVVGNQVSISGAVADGQIVGILIDGVLITYPILVSDTTYSIAANLAALIRVGRTATLAGSTFSIPGAIVVIARVMMKGSVSRGLRRQRREILVSCWCPTPLLRDSVVTAVDLALASQVFVQLDDGTRAHVRYISTQVYDQSQNALLYRRDLCYKCEFTLISSEFAPVMLFGDLITNTSSLIA